jgi:hypothetical protein
MTPLRISKKYAKKQQVITTLNQYSGTIKIIYAMPKVYSPLCRLAEYQLNNNQERIKK